MCTSFNAIKVEREIREYSGTIEQDIHKILGRKRKLYIHMPTILGDNSPTTIKNLTISKKVRQDQMKEGAIFQKAIGNFPGWTDLGVGHPSGLDCMKDNGEIIIELKNKYNTRNSSSKETMYNKLAMYKKDHPNTQCVWGIVNPNPGCTDLRTVIEHNGVKILKVQGKELFKIVFNLYGVDCSDEVIRILQAAMTKYRNQVSQNDIEEKSE